MVELLGAHERPMIAPIQVNDSDLEGWGEGGSLVVWFADWWGRHMPRAAAPCRGSWGEHLAGE